MKDAADNRAQGQADQQPAPQFGAVVDRAPDQHGQRQRDQIGLCESTRHQ
jgi:hypothetical protein